VVFILKSLCEYNETNESNPYKLDILFKDDVVLKLTIKKKLNGKVHKLVICDSYPLLKKSLRTLAKNLEIKTQKGYFPYKFVTKDTLFYKGDIPSYDYFDNMDKNLYNSIITDK